MDQLANFGPIQGLIKFWGNLSNTQRFVTIVFLITSIALLAIVSVVATRPKMTVLFSNLSSEDAGAVVAKLQEKKTPYEIDGSNIKIADAAVAETRMEMASLGLPKSGTVGFELFDKSNFGMTDFTQKLNYRRALQGELSRSIDELDGVMSSRIHIAIPEESVFSEEQKVPTASVVLKLRPGASLSQDQVGGIVHLVASAVENMKPQSVTVVDANGNELSGADGGVDSRMSASQMSLQDTRERQIQKDIQTMLERVLGPEKAVVRVSAKMNFDQTETNKELYQPISTGPNGQRTGVLTSQQAMEENYDGSTDTAGLSAASPVAGSAVANRKGGYKRVENVSKYEVSKTTEHKIVAPGQLEKLSVAVMVDGDVDTAKKASITNAVRAAAGIDDKRGDMVTVESMKFDDSAQKTEDKEMKALAARTLYLSLGKTVGAALLLLLFLVVLKGILKGVKISVPAPVVVHEVGDMPAMAMAGVGSMMGGSDGGAGMQPDKNASSLATDAAVAQAFTQITPPSSHETKYDLSQVEPDEVAQVIRKWMSEN